ncbi:MAG: hypothetical protein IPL86_15030 [Flavobacteriales bacterium]|nr:hypothetical protein [Flavobacteriales bacterium]
MLAEHPFLVLDTKHFPREWKYRLLGALDNLDEQMDGLLINSENFQALQLLQTRYHEQVKCVYIDPPYNTGEDEFPCIRTTSKSSCLAMLMYDGYCCRRP